MYVVVNEKLSSIIKYNLKLIKRTFLVLGHIYLCFLYIILMYYLSLY